MALQDKPWGFIIRATAGSFANTVVGKAISKFALKKIIKNVTKSSVSNAQKQKMLNNIKKEYTKNLFLRKLIDEHLYNLEKYDKDTAEDLTLNTLFKKSNEKKATILQQRVLKPSIDYQFDAPNINITKDGKMMAAKFDSTWVYGGLYYFKSKTAQIVFRSKTYVFPHFPLEWFLQMIYAKPKGGYGAGSVYWALYKNNAGARARTSSYRNNIQLFLYRWRRAYANKYNIL